MAEPLSDTQQAAWRAFVESSWALHTRLEDDLRATTGLSMSDYHVLVVLSERGQEAVLTDAGLAALTAAAPLHLATVRKLFIDDLDDAEIATITRVFGRLGPRLRSLPVAV
jgi:hypothetical protein